MRLFKTMMLGVMVQAAACCPEAAPCQPDVMVSIEGAVNRTGYRVRIDSESFRCAQVEVSHECIPEAPSAPSTMTVNWVYGERIVVFMRTPNRPARVEVEVSDLAMSSPAKKQTVDVAYRTNDLPVSMFPSACPQYVCQAGEATMTLEVNPWM